MKRPAHGFTLVELLVVIAILSILMTMALLVYTGLQKNTRDQKKKADLATIQSALEQYHADNGFYPSGSLAVLPAGALTNCTGGVTGCTVTRTYLSIIPVAVSGYVYNYAAVPISCNNSSAICTGYYLCVKVENSSNNNSSDTCGGTGDSYKVTAP